jgi:hypothetical protein
VSWETRGLVFRPDGSRPWLASHAQLPVALPLDGDVCRVYFASRDADNRSHVCWVEVDLAAAQVLRVCDQPVLAPGPLGNFDDHGVYPSSIVDVAGRLYLYYIGWNPGNRPPLFYSSIGLAVSDDGGLTFERWSRAPIMARSEHDPCLVTSPFVLREADGSWRMWYVSGFRWEELGGELHSYYDVKEASSRDGVKWHRDGQVAIGHHDGERNIGRPCVLREDGRYRMWYSVAGGDGYRIGYAESEDGSAWTRLGYEGPPHSDWDMDAQAYPFVFPHDGRLYMLYNGNGFGRDGFGLAFEHA